MSESLLGYRQISLTHTLCVGRRSLNTACMHAVLSLCNLMDCGPPGSSVHGILQARILEWVAMPSSRRSSQPRDQTQVFHFQAASLPSEPPPFMFISKMLVLWREVDRCIHQSPCILSYRITTFHLILYLGHSFPCFLGQLMTEENRQGAFNKSGMGFI